MMYAPAAHQYSDYSEAIDTVASTCEILGVTPYKLARLLDMGCPNDIYKWTVGDRRPSQRYCIRMMRLMKMAAVDGVKFRLVDRIEWPEGKIIWKVDQWNDKSNNGVPASKRKKKESNSPYRVPMAEFLDQS